jgi:hypothetical protein
MGEKEKPAIAVGGNEGSGFSLWGLVVLGGDEVFRGDFAGLAVGGCGVAYGINMSDFAP